MPDAARDCKPRQASSAVGCPKKIELATILDLYEEISRNSEGSRKSTQAHRLANICGCFGNRPNSKSLLNIFAFSNINSI